MNGNKTIIGHTGLGVSTDKEAGHNPVGTVPTDIEQQKVSGVIPLNSVTPIQFIFEVPDCLLPTIQVLGNGLALVSVKLYVCNDRLARPDQDQTEASDLRPAHWMEVTASYLALGANGANAAFASTAAVISNMFIFPSSNASLGCRPAWFKVVFTPSASQPADVLDMFAHATER